MSLSSLNHFKKLGAVLLLAVGAAGTIANTASATISPSYTVTFHNNVSGAADASVLQTANSAQPLTPFSQMGFSNPNYYFEDWSTQQNGGGTIFADQAQYTFGADVELYAQWVQVSHSVSFFRNSSSTDATHFIQTNNAPTSLTAFTGLSLDNPNYTFVGWNTRRDGTGTAFADQATYSFAADLQLFAQWQPDPYSLAFSANSGSGSIAPLASTFGATVTLPSGSSLTRTGYQLVGWNTDALGTGTEYPLGSSITVSGNETLFAHWTQSEIVISLSDPGQTGKLTTLPDPAGASIVLRLPAGFVRPGFTFAGWYTSATGGTLLGGSGALFTPVESTTIYARWTPNPFVDLIFSDNGGVGHMVSHQVRSGLRVLIPRERGLHRAGYVFRGWSLNPRASRPTISAGSEMLLSHSRTLYALWSRVAPHAATQVLLGNVGIFAPDSTVLTPKMRIYVVSLAHRIAARHDTAIVVYGYATSVDSKQNSEKLSLDRATAVQVLLIADLTGIKDTNVTTKAVGEGRLSNSALASFRNVEVFAE